MHLTIRLRLILLVMLACALLAVTSGFSLVALGRADHDLREVYEQRTVRIGQLMTINDRLRGSVQQLFAASLHNTVVPASRLHDHPVTFHTDQIRAYLRQVKENWERFHRVSDEHETLLVRQFATDKEHLVADGIEPVMADLLAGRFDEADASLTLKVGKLFTALEKSASALVEHQTERAAQAYRAGRERYESTRILAGILFVVGLFGCGGLGLWILLSVDRPLHQAVDAANRLAAGDLSVRLESRSRDETGLLLRAMSTMVERLRTTLDGVRSSTEAVSSASEQLSATAQALSQATTEQAGAVAGVLTTAEQLGAVSRDNAERARRTDALARGNAQMASRSGEAVAKSVAAMHTIAERIRVIDDIAYKTNLLALNAAIEAARAGAHGRGFEVVAAEVRTLAGRSQAAAQAIDDLTRDSLQVAEQAGNLVAAIVPEAGQTSALVESIARASAQQSGDAAHIHTAMEELNQVTQQNAAAAEQLAATAESLNGQAQQLQEMVAFFR